MTATDLGAGSAALLTRATPLPEVADAFDAWQYAKHLPDLMRAPGAGGVVYGSCDATRLPAALSGSASRLALYASASPAAMMTFVASAEVADAIADGSRWFGQFHDLDGEPYSGNVYTIEMASGKGFDGAEHLLVERLEVPDDMLDEFDTWLVESHVPALRGCGSVFSVRVGAAQRSGIPVPYYYSRGNRAVLVAIRLGGRHEDLTRDVDLQSALTQSRLWDFRLPYAEREVFDVRARLTAEQPDGAMHGRR